MISQYNGFVFFVESPSDLDFLDGRCEGQTLVGMFRAADIDACYCPVTSKRAFSAAFEKILGQALHRFPNKWPIIHFSAHGNENGIQLTSGEMIYWDEIRHALKPANDAMQGGLLICMSSCNGGSACRMAMTDGQQKPFWALVGNHGSPTWSSAAVAFTTFYHHFFTGSSVPEAVQAMRVASKDFNFVHYDGRVVQSNWNSFIKQQNRQALIDELMASQNGNGFLSSAAPSQTPRVDTSNLGLFALAPLGEQNGGNN